VEAEAERMYRDVAWEPFPGSLEVWVAVAAEVAGQEEAVAVGPEAVADLEALVAAEAVAAAPVAAGRNFIL